MAIRDLKNNINIVGQLTEVKEKVFAQTNDGKEYVRGKFLVKVEDTTLELAFFTNKFKADGVTLNDLYATYSSLEELLNQNVSIKGRFERNLFVASNSGEFVSSVKLISGYISKAFDNATHKATFEVAGYVTRNVTQELDEAGLVRKASFEIGNLGYTKNLEQNGKLMKINLNIATDNPQLETIVNGIENIGNSKQIVTFSGKIENLTVQIVKVKETIFGEATPEVDQRTYRSFTFTEAFVDGETIFLSDEDKMAIDSEYNADVNKVIEDTKDKKVVSSIVAPTTQAQAVTNSPFFG